MARLVQLTIVCAEPVKLFFLQLSLGEVAPDLLQSLGPGGRCFEGLHVRFVVSSHRVGFLSWLGLRILHLLCLCREKTPESCQILRDCCSTIRDRICFCFLFISQKALALAKGRSHCRPDH